MFCFWNKSTDTNTISLVAGCEHAGQEYRAKIYSIRHDINNSCRVRRARFPHGRTCAVNMKKENLVPATSCIASVTFHKRPMLLETFIHYLYFPKTNIYRLVIVVGEIISITLQTWAGLKNGVFSKIRTIFGNDPVRTNLPRITVS